MIDLPKEVMELVYRQALIWVAALYVPLIYPIGVIAHVSVFFVKYISFRGFYKAPLKPFSRSKVTRLFLYFAFASLLAVVLPFSSAMLQAANPYCGPLRARECALQPYNVSGACTYERLNYASLNDELMKSSEVGLSNYNITDAESIADAARHLGAALHHSQLLPLAPQAAQAEARQVGGAPRRGTRRQGALAALQRRAALRSSEDGRDLESSSVRRSGSPR